MRATVFTLTTEFAYNGLGARVAVSVAGQTTNFALDYAAGNRILAETTPTGTVVYLYGNDCLGEFRDDEPLYYLPNTEGYVRQGVDADGDIVSAWLFDPDGTLLEGPEGPVSHLVCGGVYDWSTGLLYKGGRYFDPVLGIWLAMLPLAVVQGGKKKRKGAHLWVMLVCVGLFAAGSLVGCGPTSDPSPTPTPSPICTETPIPPTPTPTPTPSNWFSATYGAKIAGRARELVQLSASGAISIQRDMSSCWDIDQLGQITSYVCADVVLDAYYAAGINLQELLLTSEASSNWSYPCAAVHNAQAFGQYLQTTGQLRNVGDFPYYQGEILIGYPDWAHAAVVVESGSDEDGVRLVQASYSRMIIEETTLRDWKEREGGPQSYVWHGHPSMEEISRVIP